MIVISPSLSLTAIGELRPDAPLIGWRNIVTPGSLSATSEAAGYPVTNAGNIVTALVWRAEDNADQDIEIANGDEEEAGPLVDYVGIARHNLAAIGATIYVDVLEDDSIGFETVIGPIMPANNDPLIFRFEKQAWAEIRIRIENASDPAEIGVIYAGELLVMQRNLYVGHQPITLNLSSRITNNRSETGEYLGRIVLSQSRQTSAAFENLTPAWVRENIRPFAEAAVVKPFFWAWRPTSYPFEVGFCWLTGDVDISNQRSNGMVSLSFDMSGLAL